MTEYKKAKEFLTWIILFALCWFLFTGAYIGYLYFVKDVRITPVSTIQDNYAKFLVEKHDHFLDSIIEFEAATKKTTSVYSKEELDAIQALLLEQNGILKDLQKFPPDTNNEDYYPIYQDALKIISFYIQGEIMKMEYVYNYKDFYLPEEELSGDIVGIETYTIGHELCNLMGNMLLNNYIYINQVRDTKIPSKFDILPLETVIKDKEITKEQDYSIRKDLENIENGLELIEPEEIETETNEDVQIKENNIE